MLVGLPRADAVAEPRAVELIDSLGETLGVPVTPAGEALALAVEDGGAPDAVAAGVALAPPLALAVLLPSPEREAVPDDDTESDSEGVPVRVSLAHPDDVGIVDGLGDPVAEPVTDAGCVPETQPEPLSVGEAKAVGDVDADTVAVAATEPLRDGDSVTDTVAHDERVTDVDKLAESVGDCETVPDTEPTPAPTPPADAVADTHAVAPVVIVALTLVDALCDREIALDTLPQLVTDTVGSETLCVGASVRDGDCVIDALLQRLPEPLLVPVAPPSAAAPALTLGVALALGEMEAVPLPERVVAPVAVADPPPVADPDMLALTQTVDEAGALAVTVSRGDALAVIGAVAHADEVAQPLCVLPTDRDVLDVPVGLAVIDALTVTVPVCGSRVADEPRDDVRDVVDDAHTVGDVESVADIESVTLSVGECEAVPHSDMCAVADGLAESDGDSVPLRLLDEHAVGVFETVTQPESVDVRVAVGLAVPSARLPLGDPVDDALRPIDAETGGL